MRGTLDSPCPTGHYKGIIPAYAGNTIEYKVEGATSPGSSPRMRGTPADRLRIPPPYGIIPAYAGNTVVVY